MCARDYLPTGCGGSTSASGVLHALLLLGQVWLSEERVYYERYVGSKSVRRPLAWLPHYVLGCSASAHTYATHTHTHAHLCTHTANSARGEARLQQEVSGRRAIPFRHMHTGASGDLPMAH
jgi:hypothetical protein